MFLLLLFISLSKTHGIVDLEFADLLFLLLFLLVLHGLVSFKETVRHPKYMTGSLLEVRRVKEIGIVEFDTEDLLYLRTSLDHFYSQILSNDFSADSCSKSNLITFVVVNLRNNLDFKAILEFLKYTLTASGSLHC